MGTLYLLARVTNGLIAVENESGLLFALAILKDSASIAEQNALCYMVHDFT